MLLKLFNHCVPIQNTGQRVVSCCVLQLTHQLTILVLNLLTLDGVNPHPILAINHDLLQFSNAGPGARTFGVGKEQQRRLISGEHELAFAGPLIG